MADHCFGLGLDTSILMTKPKFNMATTKIHTQVSSIAQIYLCIAEITQAITNQSDIIHIRKTETVLTS